MEAKVSKKFKNSVTSFMDDPLTANKLENKEWMDSLLGDPSTIERRYSLRTPALRPF
jgi:hypothetical protein